MHECSDGSRVSQSTIERRYAESREEKYAGITTILKCEAGCGRTGNHNDHTIAQAHCKQLHKTELIWHPGNYVWSCNICHKQWESFKSGEWLHHANVEERLLFLHKHDPEGYNVRFQLTAESIDDKLKALNENMQKRLYELIYF